MEVEIETIEYPKPIKKTVKVSIPEKEMYLWHNGIRRAYSVTPIWTTWNVEHKSKPEEIYEYKIVTVDPQDREIKVSKLPVYELPKILKDAKHPFARLVDNILNYPEDKEWLRTKEDFEKDLKGVLNEIVL